MTAREARIPWRGRAAAALCCAALGCGGGKHAVLPLPEAPARAPAAAVKTERIAPVAVPVQKTRTCFTLGAAEAGTAGSLRVTAPETRAVFAGSSGRTAGMRFRYLGVSERLAKLASGQIRTQIGLKLTAQDGCNVLYVMWRVSPRNEVVVSSKRNSGQSTHAECGAHGYANLVPARSAAPPPLDHERWHDLSARLDGTALAVEIDGTRVWEGTVDVADATRVGPAGFRTDNGQFEIRPLRIEASGPASADVAMPRCSASMETREPD